MVVAPRWRHFTRICVKRKIQPVFNTVRNIDIRKHLREDRFGFDPSRVFIVPDATARNGSRATLVTVVETAITTGISVTG